jgi:hypothetical protein
MPAARVRIRACIRVCTRQACVCVCMHWCASTDACSVLVRECTARH